MKDFFGLIAGPLILIVIGYALFGEWGSLVAFFVIVSAVFFIPLFKVGTRMMGTSLHAVLAVANLIPFGFYLLGCAGRACPNYTFAAAAPQYIAATFCGFVYWFFVARKS